MFNQLKKKLLAINMISISLLMIIAFGSIFFFTYNRTSFEIQNALNRLESTKPSVDRPLIVPEREISFILDLDAQNRISSSHSFFSADDAFFENAIALVQSGNNDKYIELEGDKWAYRIVNRFDYTQMLFIEVTTQLNSLNRLAYTFVAVFLVMFVLNYLFSNYMTNESIKPIKNAFDQQNQFLTDASHELKTPLAIIGTNVDVLLGGTEDSEKWLNYIKSEVTRMGKLTENLLYLSQFNDKSSAADISDINMSELCEHVLLGMEAVAFEKNRTLHYDIEPSVFVKGNYEQLSQVLLILLDNAIKYSSDQGCIDVILTRGSQVHLEVSNDGPGIANDAIDKIFNRFYKIDESRSQTAGYGLGLAIAKSIVDHHHGTISCHSELDKTTRFTIKLPQ